MDYLATFLEGIITFISPCLLPLLPVYLAFFAGGAGEGSHHPAYTLARAAAFVAGFGVVFVAFGAFAGAIGAFLVRWRRVLDVACGLLVVILGLNYLGVLHIELLERTSRRQAPVTGGGLAAAFSLGVTFAVGWSPCVGTFLASALSLAASSGSVARGVALLVCFVLGLGLPFVLTAALIDQLEGVITWVKSHYDVVNRVSGVLLVAFGLLMATGLVGRWVSLLAG